MGLNIDRHITDMVNPLQVKGEIPCVMAFYFCDLCSTAFNAPNGLVYLYSCMIYSVKSESHTDQRWCHA